MKKVTLMNREELINDLVRVERTVKFKHAKAQPEEKRDFYIMIETIRNIRQIVESGKFDIRG